MSASDLGDLAPQDAIEFRSRLPGVAWPAVPDERGMTMLALQYQFERTERWAPERLRRFQFQQLEILLRHAAAHVPHYKEVLARAGFGPEAALTGEVWQRIPVLSRADVQREGARLRAAAIPAFHGAVHEVVTSGSTGTPVRVLTTELSGMLFDAVALREAFWHRRNFAGVVAVVRAPRIPIPKGGKRAANWNRAIGAALVGGPSVLFDCTRPAADLARSIARLDPDYLLIYPSLLAEILREAERQGLRFPALAEVSTFGEHLSDEVRAAARAELDVPVCDVYSAEEVGYIALQCPDCTAYHVQSETVLVEVLDPEGRACAPGASGRVVVTPLHNFASPLLRYDIGDRAELGGPCTCGRGLPVLTRILGRVRNMLVAPDGTRFWPRLNALFKASGLPIRQFQVIQRAPDRLELRLATARPFVAAEEEGLRRILRGLCRADYIVEISYHAAIPRGPSGKYEDFVCEIAAPAGVSAIGVAEPRE